MKLQGYLSAQASSSLIAPEVSLPGWPHYADDEIRSVAGILASGRVNYWTGQEGREFEREYAQYLGASHAIALMNGTVALELALRLWGIGAGDEVIVTSRSFVASASCVAFIGARPIFADVDCDSGNITADTIERVLTARTKAIIVVHLAGWPCEMDEIMALAKRHDIKVLEDCAQAHGATYKGRRVGAIGDAGAFSFCQDKIISTGGEGGLFVTQDSDVWERAWAFKDHGKSFRRSHATDHAPGFRWLHESIGTNWRMTEIQAAIGRLQLQKLPIWHAQRTENAQTLRQCLTRVPGLRIPVPPSYSTHAYYRQYLYVELEALSAGWTRDRIIAEVSAHGVPCFSGSCPEIYREKAFVSARSSPADVLPVARKMGESSIALLVHPTMTAEHMSRIGALLAAAFRAAVR